MRTIVTMVFLMAIGVVYGQKSKSPVMNWRSVTPDEISADPSEYSVIDKGKMLCYLSNNEESIFLDLIIQDAPTQKKVLDVGMNVWFDVTGKDKKDLGVRYPLGANTVRAQLTRKGDRMTQDEIMMLSQNSALSMAYEMELVGFGEGLPPRARAVGTAGFMAKIYYNDDGDLIYRLVIPSEKFVAGESKGKTIPFSVGIEYGASMILRPQGAAPAGGAGGAARSGPPAGGGGRTGGGGSGGGRPGGAMPSSSGQQSVAQIVWIKDLVPAGK